MSLSQDCYQRAGKTFNLNPAACSDPSVLDERTREHVRDHVARQVIVCGAKAAAADQQINASERFPHGNPYRLIEASDLIGPHASVSLPSSR